MYGTATESVGTFFRSELLKSARDRTLAALLEAAAHVRPGLRESEARRLVQETLAAHGSPKSWHPPQIRFGVNTLLPFGRPGLGDPELHADDVFFFDVGPVFDDHEGDVGRSFAVGSDPEMFRICADAEVIWRETRTHWSRSGATGCELYEFAQEQAERRGWMLTLEKANGHRIADFPHAARARGSVEGWPSRPAANRWILEIQIRSPDRPFGAFFEDLLD